MEKTPQEKAFEKAHEIRQFEIELYWKRTTYFWAFIATSFAGYFAILSSNIPIFKEQYLFLIESIGFIFSLGWLFVNKGSKHWQENWEAVIGKLEYSFTGDLMKTNIKNNNKLFSITDSYPISVSRTNQIVCFFILIIWIVLQIQTSIDIFQKYSLSLNGNYMYPVTLIVLVGFIIVIIRCGKSKHDSNITLRDIAFPEK